MFMRVHARCAHRPAARLPDKAVAYVFGSITLDTMLRMDALDEHVQRHYGIHGTITAVPRGRASNYAVSQAGSRWLLKVFQSEYTRTRIEQAADFVSFVVSAGYPAREFVPSTNGARVDVGPFSRQSTLEKGGFSDPC